MVVSAMLFLSADAAVSTAMCSGALPEVPDSVDYDDRMLGPSWYVVVF